MEADLFPATAWGEFASQDGTSRENVTTGSALTTTEVTFVRRAKACFTVNAAVGVEFRPPRSLGLLMGIYTDFAPTRISREAASDDALLLAEQSRYAFTIGGLTAGAAGELMAGVDLSLLPGTAASLNAYSTPARLEWTGTGALQLLLVLAGNMSMDTLKQAASQVDGVFSASKATASPASSLAVPAKSP